MTIRLTRREAIAGLGAGMGALALPACRSSDKGFDAEVIVLGAGLSGLHAGRILVAEGKDVLVLEGSNRIGGRLHTLDHGDGHYTEGGGEQIGASYARIIDTADQLGVTLEPDNVQPRETSYYYKGKLYGPEDWKNLDTHPFPPSFKGASPGSPLFQLAAKNNPLTAPGDWQDPKFAKYDISAEQFLTRQGFDGEARRVIDVALNGNRLRTYSMMNLYRSLQLYSQSRDMGPSLSVEGGAQRLPEAMAKSLRGKVKLAQIITSISVSDDAVTITTKAGESYQTPHCISALPFGSMRNISVAAPFNDMQKYAIEHLPYTQIYQVHFQAEFPFWEKDGLPLDMWTDSSIERIFGSRDRNGKPTNLFRAWVNGRKASLWALKTDPKNQFTSIFKKVRPASEGKIKVLTLQNWTKANQFAGGAYMHWAPQQIPLMAENMGTPTGRLSFAGEHLSHLHTGMEGAMESGENAALALLGL